MAGNLIDVSEFEVDRERDLLENSKYSEMSIQEMEEVAAPGTFMCHEVVHMSYLLYTMTLSQLSGHPAVMCNKSWYIKSRQIAHLLHELHDEMSVVHGEEGELIEWLTYT